MPVVIETREEFIQRHGGSPITSTRREVRVSPFGHMSTAVEVPDPGHWLLPDGAMIVHNTLGADALIEPPGDERARIELQLKYSRLRLKPMERDFELLKWALKGGDPFSWPPQYGAYHNDPKDALRHLKMLVTAERERGAALQERFDALPEVVAERERLAAVNRMQEDARRRAHRDEMEIDSISI